MITIAEMQFGGMLTMTMLTLMLLLCVPRRSALHAGFGQARWLMASGTALIAAQFLLQHIGGFRQMGVVQAVLWNLLLFMPAAMLVNMAILYVQRQGRVGRKEWIIGGSLCTLNAIILVTVLMADGVPLESESPTLERAEYVGAILFAMMQSHFFQIHFKEYRRLQLAVDEYFDRDRHDLLGWMLRSTTLLASLTILVPIAIFFQGLPLVVFSVMLFFCIAYSVISFYSYGISEDVKRVEESEQVNSEETSSEKKNGERDDDGTDNDGTLNNEVMQHVAQAVEQWKASGAYREHNLTLGIVARQMHITGKQLQLWLRNSEYVKLATLVTELRIEDAKQMLLEHPEWTIDSIAENCGFNGRKYFHQVFLEHTGTTPAKYQQIQHA